MLGLQNQNINSLFQECKQAEDSSTSLIWLCIQNSTSTVAAPAPSGVAPPATSTVAPPATSTVAPTATATVALQASSTAAPTATVAPPASTTSPYVYEDPKFPSTSLKCESDRNIGESRFLVKKLF